MNFKLLFTSLIALVSCQNKQTPIVQESTTTTAVIDSFKIKYPNLDKDKYVSFDCKYEFDRDIWTVVFYVFVDNKIVYESADLHGPFGRYHEVPDDELERYKEFIISMANERMPEFVKIRQRM